MPTLGTLFSGGRLADIGFHQAGYTSLWAVEYDAKIAAAADVNFDMKTIVADVCEVDYAALERVDHIHASPVCFPSGVTVVSERGIIPIEQIMVGDKVLTHMGRYMPVLETCQRQAATVQLIGLGHWGLECTPDHPFLAATSKWRSEEYATAKAQGRPRKTIMEFSEPSWTPAIEMTGKYWFSFASYPVLPIPEIAFQGNESLRGQAFIFSPAFFWLVGAWLGDGWARYSNGDGNARNRGQVSICASYAQAGTMEQHLNAAGVRFGSTKRKATVEFFISSRPLARWLIDNFGHGAANKTLPAWALGMSHDLRQALFDGYCFADGWKGKRREHLREFAQLRTISKSLAVGMRMLALSIGLTASSHAVQVNPTTIIEGRTVNQKPAFMVRCSSSDRLSRRIGAYRSGLVRKCEPCRQDVTVYCLNVAEDHSFVADGIVVHNCKNASQANVDAAETGTDIATAMAVCRAIEALQPPTFSLENVWQYRTFEAFQRICAALTANGYNVEYWHLNSADYGVPQTRKRLILLARKNGRIQRPSPTHREGGDMFHPPWIGWYASIEDLLPTLPESAFAPWQLERLPREVAGSFLSYPENTSREATIRNTEQPSFTILSGMFRRPISVPSAFIVDGQANNHGATLTLRRGYEPMYTIAASGEKRPARAFLVHHSEMRSTGVVMQEEPAFTIMTHAKQHRAWLQHGKVVKMTPRALGRFQSLPDWYVLPSNNALASTIIGNGVPCRMAYHIGMALR